jgi:hypothetical protein
VIAAVIPGRRAAASPESVSAGKKEWIPGSRASLAPRNDNGQAYGFHPGTWISSATCALLSGAAMNR